MNTPEALEASSAIVSSLGITDEDRDLLATIIDRHFEPLRRDNAALAGRLTAAELERDDLGARAEQAEALLRETEAVAAQPMMRDDPRYKGTSYGEPAKHPDSERLDWLENGFAMLLIGEDETIREAIDRARKEVQS